MRPPHPPSPSRSSLFAVLLQPLASTRRLGEPVPSISSSTPASRASCAIAGPWRTRGWRGCRSTITSSPTPCRSRRRTGPGRPWRIRSWRSAPLLWVGLLALQVSNAGRLVFRDARAGALGAAVALLHTDPGQFLGLGPGAFNSHLATGIYGSPTTVCGLVLLAGLTVSLESWVEAGGRRRLAALALLAAAASGAKTTRAPGRGGRNRPGAAWPGRSDHRDRELRRWVAALVVAAAAGAPLTLWQTSGERQLLRDGALGARGGFLELRPSPWPAPAAMGPGAHASALPLPRRSRLARGHLGLAGVAAASGSRAGTSACVETQVWALAVAAVGLAATLALDVPGLSQLFLLYNGQLLLCLFAGAGLARAARGPGAASRPRPPSSSPSPALPVVDRAARALPAAARADAAAAASASSSRGAGLRATGSRGSGTAASRDAVVFADNPSLLLSAFGEVRLYYENGALHRQGVAGGALARAVAGADRACRSGCCGGRTRRPWRRRGGWWAAPTAPGRRRLRALARSSPGSCSPLPGPVPPRRFFPRDLFERRFANGAHAGLRGPPDGRRPTGR